MRKIKKYWNIIDDLLIPQLLRSKSSFFQVIGTMRETAPTETVSVEPRYVQPANSVAIKTQQPKIVFLLFL